MEIYAHFLLYPAQETPAMRLMDNCFTFWATAVGSVQVNVHPQKNIDNLLKVRVGNLILVSLGQIPS